MIKSIWFKIKLCLGFGLASTLLLLLVMLLSSYLQPSTVSAQEPDEEESLPSLTSEILGSFGLSPQAIPAASDPFDLKITQTADKSKVSSGDSISFLISITNEGAPISPTLFYDNFPPEMKNVTYKFSSGSGFVSNGQTKPWWLSYEPIGNGETVTVTVTGNLVSAPDVTVQNTALITVTPFHAPEEETPGDNISTVDVQIEGYNPTKLFYLPLIFKSPPIVIVYSDDFSNDDSGWYEGYSDGDDCYSKYEGGRYWLDLVDNHSCFRPAPAAANRTYGSFEVSAYHSEGASNASYGVYSNGAGGDTYYLFKIFPNNGCGTGGDWELYRKSTRVRHGDCEPAINRGLGSGAENRLKIKHTSDGKITVFVNDKELGTYNDGSQLTGSGTGVYASSSNQDIVIKYTQFTVYAP